MWYIDLKFVDIRTEILDYRRTSLVFLQKKKKISGSLFDNSILSFTRIVFSLKCCKFFETLKYFIQNLFEIFLQNSLDSLRIYGFIYVFFFFLSERLLFLFKIAPLRPDKLSSMRRWKYGWSMFIRIFKRQLCRCREWNVNNGILKWEEQAIHIE